MSIKIKLPDQEWLGYDPERGDMHGYSFEQMRAHSESLIKECLDIVRSQMVGSVHSQASPYNAAVDQCHRKIKEHFGVE